MNLFVPLLPEISLVRVNCKLKSNDRKDQLKQLKMLFEELNYHIIKEKQPPVEYSREIVFKCYSKNQHKLYA